MINNSGNECPVRLPLAMDGYCGIYYVRTRPLYNFGRAIRPTLLLVH